MREPYLSEFKRMICGGSASRDVHDADDVSGFADANGRVDEAFLAREVGRVDVHRQSLTPLLARYIGRAERILDFGCGTGGTTVALALSELGATETVGVDANSDAIAAARVRADGHDLAAAACSFEHVAAGERLPFPDASFDLAVSVSVMEFISRAEDRAAVAAELRRVIKPGGFLFIATPRPGAYEYHSRELLGDLRRKAGMPWASPPWQVAAWGSDWKRVSVSGHLASRVTRRLTWMPERLVATALGPVLPLLGRWQKALWQLPTMFALWLTEGEFVFDVVVATL